MASSSRTTSYASQNTMVTIPERSGTPDHSLSTHHTSESAASPESARTEDHDYDDDEEYEEEYECLDESNAQSLKSSVNGKHSGSRSRPRLSKNDADSIVGGESLTDILKEHLPQTPQSKAPTKQTNPSHKVFSFSLPFGGLSNVRSNIAKQLQNFKFDGLPLLGNHTTNVNNNLKHEMKLKLERQLSISTVDDAHYFKHVKKQDNSRIRAVKKSLTNNLNEFLPNKKAADLKNYESIFNDIEGNIVIMGGYRGSVLRDAKTHKRVWIPIKAGFNLRKINLLLGPTQEDELHATDLIYPDGVLTNIGPIDICKKLIKKLSNNPKTNVKEYGYDWRLSADTTAKYFETFLQDIYDKTGKPTLVIAHSMGGLIAHGTLQSNPKLFRSIVYAGVPSECPNILGPLRFTDPVILSDRILTHEVNFMMRSSFVFLPLSGRLFVDENTKEFYDLDFFDPEVWVEYNLSPLVAKKRRIIEERQKRESLGLPVSPQVSSVNLSPSVSPRPSTPTSITESNLSFPSMFSNKLKQYRAISMSRIYKPSTDPTTSASSLGSAARSPTQASSECDGKSPKSSSKVPPNMMGTAPGVPMPGSQNSVNTNTSLEQVEEQSFAISFTQAYEYLSDTLRRAKAYILSLEYREELEAEYPPMAVVYGNQVPSVRGSFVNGRQDIKDGNYFGFFYGHGDGVVHQKWLMPKRKGFRYYDKSTGEGQIVGEFASDSGHVSLMTDFKAMGRALSAVCDAEVGWRERKELKRKVKEMKVEKVGR